MAAIRSSGWTIPNALAKPNFSLVTSPFLGRNCCCRSCCRSCFCTSDATIAALIAVSLPPTIVSLVGPGPLLLVRDMMSPIVPETNSAPTASIEFLIVDISPSGALCVEDESRSTAEASVLEVALVGIESPVVVEAEVSLGTGTLLHEVVVISLVGSEISFVGSSPFVMSSRYQRVIDFILENFCCSMDDDALLNDDTWW